MGSSFYKGIATDCTDKRLDLHGLKIFFCAASAAQGIRENQSI